MHNAFLSTYAELGFLGGTLLFGQYFFCLTNLRAIGSKRTTITDPEMHRLQPFLMASLASFATSEMTLTNPISPVTYVMFGLATAFIRVADPIPPPSDIVLSGVLARKVIRYSVLFLAALYAFVRLSVRY
jgi:hypothetical protein